MTEKQSLLPEEIKTDKHGRPFNYGFFGYRGWVCDQAIRTDNPAMLAECIERDYVGADDEILTFKTVRQFCKEIAPKCYAMLQEKVPVAA
jgi:hypothetical protein